MDYKEINPEGGLNGFVKFFWRYQHSGEDVEYTLIPDACFDLVVDFENNELQNIYLTGIWTKPINITVTKGTTLLAVRFKMLASEYLLKTGLKALLNSMTIFPNDFWDIQKSKCTEFEGFASDLSKTMVGLLNEQPKMDHRKLKLFHIIYSEEFQTVSELSERVGWSSRQINRYFNTQFGFSLKTFINIVRCNASYPGIVEGKLYPEKAFTDQAHYIKEIKKYTENSPGQLFKNQNDRFLQLSVLKAK
jgi:AraC-like DNA-binding protein